MDETGNKYELEGKKTRNLNSFEPLLRQVMLMMRTMHRHVVHSSVRNLENGT